MSYSKVFSGELPELTYEIMKYFQNDFLILHSCILVNRSLCRLAIPLLWENPFSIPTKNYKFIEIYLLNLNDDLKTKLNIYKIDDNLFHSNTLFNYPSFIKYLNMLKVITSVNKWFENSVRTSKPGSKYFLPDSNILSAAFNFKRLIYMSLFKIFIENEVSLHTLDIDIFTTSGYEPYYIDIFELILQNPNFIHNIKYLKLQQVGSSGRIFRFFDYDYSNEYTLLNYHILQVINLHQNLKKILLDHDSFLSYQSLLLSEDYNCSNTLNTIILYEVNFNGVINLDKAFEQLNVLESVHIIYCSSLYSSFTQQIINLTKPFKLKSLFIEEKLQINSLELLFQKSGGYLENFVGTGFDTISLQQHLLELITKYCNNIKFLGFYKFEDLSTPYLISLIESIKHNLNYLSINISNQLDDYGSILLQKLGQILPSKLEYLSLSLAINESDLEIFLENSRNIFINKLLITQRPDRDDILHCIKKFIMKEKRVKYLAIMDFKHGNLFNLKDEVNEFLLHGIRVINFDDLYLDVDYKAYNFIKNIEYSIYDHI